MKRAALVLLLVACGGNKQLSPDACKQRADAIEARVRAQIAEEDALQAIVRVVDPIYIDSTVVPDAEEGSTDFAAGVPVPISAAKPDVLEAVAAAEACAAKPTKRPVRLYFVALPAEDAAIAESGAWLALASNAWGVELQARRVVHLQRRRELYPWPPHSESAQALAKTIFPAKGEPDLATLRAEVSRVTRGCPAIDKAVQSGDLHTHLDLALPLGLRECGCSVDNLDELESVWHLQSANMTSYGWVPPPEDVTTRRSVSPLSCESAHDPIIIGTYEHWTGGSGDMRPALLGLLDGVTKCRDSIKLDHSAVIHIRLASQRDPSTSIDATTHSGTALFSFDQCMEGYERFDVAEPISGTADVLVYLPAAN